MSHYNQQTYGDLYHFLPTHAGKGLSIQNEGAYWIPLQLLENDSSCRKVIIISGPCCKPFQYIYNNKSRLCTMFIIIIKLIGLPWTMQMVSLYLNNLTTGNSFNLYWDWSTNDRWHNRKKYRCFDNAFISH